MAKTLSQAEIDALLSTVSTPDTPHRPPTATDDGLRTIIVYDFKHPNRVSKDQLRTLESMHDNFAGHVSSVLSNVHRAMVDVDLVSVDQITYSEYVASLVSPSCTFTFTAEPLEGACIIDFNPSLTYGFIERLFGGNGKVIDTGRELTGIERSLMQRIVQMVYTQMEDAWAQICPAKITPVSLETNPQFLQIVPPGETVIVVSFQLKLLQSTGLMTICYPYVALEPVITKLSAQNWMDATKKKTEGRDTEVNKHNLMKLALPLRVVLATTEVKIRDFLNMQMGDVIMTGHKIDSEVSIEVKDRAKFCGRPGLIGKKKGILVTRVCEE